MKFALKFSTATMAFFGLLTSIHVAYGQGQLKKDIVESINSIKADVGVAILHLENGDTLSFNGLHHFPMQSVYKFHLALAVLHAVDQGKLSLDHETFIAKSDFIPKTWSPIADKYPEGDVKLTVSQLLSYTISQSDNNGCDILFRLVGGPRKVDEYIKGLGIIDVAIANTEAEMHENPDLQFKNWTTPRAMVQLLSLFYQGKILASPTHNLLVEMMEQTITGNKRIKGQLPQGTVVAHRTGMSGQNEDGVRAALNDVGIITLPNGKHIAVALFVSNTRESIPASEELIAKISRIVFDYYSIDAGKKK
nr:VEB-PER_beta_lactamase [uncultured bacterium]